MTNGTTRLIIAGIIAAGASDASAQTAQLPPAPANMGFVNVNIGAQPASRTVDVNQSFALYSETATLTTSQKIGSGALFDVSGGYRVWRNVSAAIGFSSFGNRSDSVGSARVPHPLIFNQAVTVDITQPDLSHRERTVHFQASWLFPVTNEFDVTLALGPSIFNLKQELVNSVTVTPGTQNATPSVASESETALGLNFQVDGNYLVRRNLGAGVFIRYASRKVDLPSVPDVRVGGFQLGGGARFRF
jgi:hypothetical protein